MRRPHVDWAGVAGPAVLAALTSWVTLWAWGGFVTSPSGFLLPALGGALLVAATGAGLRSLHLPVLVVLVAQLAVLTHWLTHRWAPDLALWGWVPTGSSVRESLAVLNDGVVAAQSYAAPVPESAPEIHEILLAAGLLVAVLVDFLACGLRRAPLAGLPLLAVYTAPVSILDDGVPWWAFAVAATGFLALIVSDEGRRLTRWGRQVSRGSFVDSGAGPVGGTSIRMSARRIGFTATALAVVSPVVVPTLSTGLLPGPGDGGDGSDSVRISNPMVNLRRDLVRGADVELLTVTTPDQNANPTYLRITVLDTFNGITWKPSDRDIPTEQRADGELPSVPGLDSSVPRREIDYRISVEEEFDTTWLPTPYPVTAIEVPGDWRYDKQTRDFVSAVEGEDAAGLEYFLTSLELRPTADDLVGARPAPESIFTPYTDLPDEMPDTVAGLARELTAGLGSRFEKAVRLQRWFREDGGFQYSLRRSPGNGADDLVAFLSTGPDGRVGYCEQFAAAMAVMGRTLGIPSRVAVGFLRPERVSPGEFVYSAHDLHAWPEMYFDGVGWVRFEPTPSDRAARVPGYTSGAIGTPEPTELPSSSAQPDAADQIPRNQREADAAAGGGGDSGGNGGWATLAVALGALVLLLAPRSARSAVRRRRWATAATAHEVAEAAWRELRDLALDLRLPWDASVTFRTRARSLAAAFGTPGTDQADSYAPVVKGPEADPDAARSLERLVRDVELARYSRGAGDTLRPAAAVRADVERCEAALRAGTSKKRRRAATWLPASLLRNGAWRDALAARGQRVVPLADPGVDRAV